MRKLLVTIVALSCLVCLLLSQTQILTNHYAVTQLTSDSLIREGQSVNVGITRRKNRVSRKERRRKILQLAKQLAQKPQQTIQQLTDDGERWFSYKDDENALRHNQSDQYLTFRERRRGKGKMKSNFTHSVSSRLPQRNAFIGIKYENESESNRNSVQHDLIGIKTNNIINNVLSQIKNNVQNNVHFAQSSQGNSNTQISADSVMKYPQEINIGHMYPTYEQILKIIRSSSLRNVTMEFITRNEHICVGITGEEIELLVGVYVSLKEKALRQFVRSTWGSKAKVGSKIRLVFIVGKSENPLQMSRIQKENNLYHDIVQADFLDTYRNLTLKSIAFFHWVDRFCRNAKHILKIDSDMQINLSQLLTVLQTRSIPDKFICGYILPRSIVVREEGNKWYVSFQTYPNECYPTYCHGAAFIISQRIGRKIAKIPVPSDPFPIDDAYISGIVREFLGESIEKGLITFDHHYEPTETKVQMGNYLKYIMTVHVDDFSLL